MGVKLFRATEFADSQGYHPGEQRRALHPAWMVAFCAFWMAVPGNWVLWRSLSLVPQVDATDAMGLALRLATLLGLACAVLLLAGCWRRTARLWATLGLTANALVSLAVAGQGQLRIWQTVLCVLLLAVLPAAVVWRVRWKRLSLIGQVRMVLGGAVVCVVAGATVLLISQRELSALKSRAPWVFSLSVPFGPTGASARVEKILLRQQP
jgi:Phosphoethanolamine transferase EptA/EptB